MEDRNKKKCCHKNANITVNQIVPIDYDKLAEAMNKAKEDGEKTDGGKYVTGTFASLTGLAFRIASVLAWCILVALSISVKDMFCSFTWEVWTSWVSNIIVIAFMLVFAFVVGLFAVLLWKSAKEVDDERDKHYVVAVFSAVVSSAALIVALVTLFKGVG